MAKREGSVHVDSTQRRYKGKVYRSHLLRRSYREGGKVKKETLGNLSHLPAHVIDLVRQSLKGETFVPATERFEIVESKAHGHVQAVLKAMTQLGFQGLLASRPSKERDLVTAMVASRLFAPTSKLSTARSWHTTTLPEELGVLDATEDDLYGAMDWLLDRQAGIEKRLSQRHLEADGLVLYDLSSSYFEGTTCPLAALGHNRDGKKGKLQVNYGLLTNGQGCPVAVSVFDGNTSDTKTLMPQVERVRDDFGIENVVLVGDRGMISQKQIDELQTTEGVDWITALRSGSIRKLMNEGYVQLGLFDERNLFELTHPDYPGERLVACRNPELQKLRGHKRRSLLEATHEALDKIRERVAGGRLVGKDKIGVAVGRVINKYKVEKHFVLEIERRSFSFNIDEESVARESALDGIYVVRTSLPRKKLGAAEAVRSYKLLANVERAFRSLKTVDLKVRPIHHHLEDRVRAHIFLCMLAYYVEWHILQAWRPLLFSDEDQEAKATRDPVAAAERSIPAMEKAHYRCLADGTATHSFQTLITEMSSIVRNTCRVPGQETDSPCFKVVTTPNPKQQEALGLLDSITV